MLKKIILWGSLVVLSALLVFGAVNRTIAKSEAPESGSGIARGRTEQTTLAADPESQPHSALNPASAGWRGRQGQGNGEQPAIETQESSQGKLGQEARQGQAENQPAQPGAGQAEAGEVVELLGIVTAVDESTLTVFASNQQSLEIAGRAWIYAQAQGFSLVVGDQVQINGFFEDQDFEVIQIANLSSSQSLVLREASGRPMWAGRGRQGG